MTPIYLYAAFCYTLGAIILISLHWLMRVTSGPVEKLNNILLVILWLFSPVILTGIFIGFVVRYIYIFLSLIWLLVPRRNTKSKDDYIHLS